MGLLPDDSTKNPNANEPWTKGEVDRLLELYFAGCPPARIGIALKRNPKAIHRILEQFSYNERDRAVRYMPTNVRTSRKGKPITVNENVIIAEHSKRGIASAHTARLLQRDVNEFARDMASEERHNRNRDVSTLVDLVLAYRYCYYVKGISIVTDQAYDLIEKEAKEFAAGGPELDTPGSDNAESYSPEIRALAMYLIFKYAKREGG